MTVEFLPVVERRAGQGGGWLVLSADATDGTVAEVIASIADYNHMGGRTLHGMLSKLARAEHLVAPGGLRVRARGFEIHPSCCCGLEGWREWFGVKPGGQSPWLGHDPGPYVDCLADHAVLWTDQADRSPASLVASYAEVAVALAAAETALTGFAGRLRAWLSAEAPDRLAFADVFARQFAVHA